ncbi:SprT-like domain-containing protein [Halorubellus litoreus]|uniref:SprT-like domain-containing protein n=1 Tax=Halorubellus litoreus TaxID=755308 RepID=A0ABD5V9T1_9EURY
MQSGTPDPDTPRDLLSYARLYAESVDVDVDHDAIEWEVSKRARRRAGACSYDADSGTVTIRLTWDAYEQYGWRQFTATIRHELVHAWEFQRFGEAGHGERFREKAAAVDAPRHCESFTDPRLALACTASCEWRAGRHRASKPVKQPGGYRCPDCGADVRVEHLASGVTWTDAAGYERARAVVDDW